MWYSRAVLARASWPKAAKLQLCTVQPTDAGCGICPGHRRQQGGSPNGNPYAEPAAELPADDAPLARVAAGARRGVATHLPIARQDMEHIKRRRCAECRHRGSCGCFTSLLTCCFRCFEFSFNAATALRWAGSHVAGSGTAGAFAGRVSSLPDPPAGGSSTSALCDWVMAGWEMSGPVGARDGSFGPGCVAGVTRFGDDRSLCQGVMQRRTEGRRWCPGSRSPSWSRSRG